MDIKFKIILLIALIIYVISPVDLVPGPIDDIILCLAYAIANWKIPPKNNSDKIDETEDATRYY